MFLKLVFLIIKTIIKALTDFILSTVWSELMLWAYEILGWPRYDISVSSEVVRILYFQGITFCTLMYYPFFAWLAPILLYIRFKYSLYALEKHKKAPQESSSSPDTESFLMIFYLITLIVAIAYYGMFIQQESKSTCGPLKDAGIPADLTFAYLMSYPILVYFIDGILYAPLLWLLVFMLLWDLIYSGSRNDSLRDYGDQLKNEHRKQVEALNSKIGGLQKQLEIHKANKI